MLGARETRQAIIDGTTSAVAECEAAIERIEALNPAINAVIVKTYDRARADAAAADAAAAAGNHLPLLGVPMTIKESFELADTPSTWGFVEHKGNVVAVDGSTVARLRAAGAVILGKTNVPVALADIQSVNPIYGRTLNPLDHTRTPGGSSGGSAASLASGMVPLEFGTDIGGSIRTPAHFCGVFGHKTTYGTIPLDGHRRPGTDGADRPLSVAGPLARDPRDIAVALDVAAPVELPRARFDSLKGVRLLVLTVHPRAGVMRGIAEGIEELARRAEQAGAIVTRSSDLLPDLGEVHDQYMRMLNLTITGGQPMPSGEVPTLQQWFALLDAQARAQRAMARLFGEVDAIIMPVHGTTAFPHDDTPDLRERKLTIDGRETRYADQFAWIGLATFTGLPSTSTPIGAVDGLPYNVQVIGGARRDHDTLAIAGMLHALSDAGRKAAGSA